MLPWYGLLAPPGTPREVAAELNRELNRALAAPDLITRLEGVDAEVVRGTPESLAKHLDQQTQLVQELLRSRKN
jgi:tripartite-type tricarboxylate transporter receptor subunit TctC